MSNQVPPYGTPGDARDSSNAPTPNNYGSIPPPPPPAEFIAGIPSQTAYTPTPPIFPPYQQPDQGGGMAIAGLVLGIIGMLAWLIPCLGAPITIVGIILSALGRKSVSRRTLATVGLVLSIIALILVIINGALGAYLGYQRVSGY